MKKELTNAIVEEYEVSITRACKMMEIHRSYFYYREKRDDTEVEEAIRKAAEHGDGLTKSGVTTAPSLSAKTSGNGVRGTI